MSSDWMTNPTRSPPYNTTKSAPLHTTQSNLICYCCFHTTQPVRSTLRYSRNHTNGKLITPSPSAALPNVQQQMAITRRTFAPRQDVP